VLGIPLEEREMVLANLKLDYRCSVTTDDEYVGRHPTDPGRLAGGADRARTRVGGRPNRPTGGGSTLPDPPGRVAQTGVCA
jgi:hypothetical protein